MKLPLLPSIVLVLLTSLQVGAQSIDQHGRKIPAITADVQAQLSILATNLDNKVSKDYSIITVDSNSIIDNKPADLYKVNSNNNPISLKLPLISDLPNGGKAIITITDFTGNAYFNNISISASGSEMISGNSNLIIMDNFQAITLMAVPGANGVNIWIRR